jgi:hypothetical protein
MSVDFDSNKQRWREQGRRRTRRSPAQEEAQAFDESLRAKAEPAVCGGWRSAVSSALRCPAVDRIALLFPGSFHVVGDQTACYCRSAAQVGSDDWAPA